MGEWGRRPLGMPQAVLVAALLPLGAAALHLRSPLRASSFVDGPVPGLEGYEALHHGARFDINTKEMAALGGQALLFVLIGGVGLAISMLLVCGMYDTAARWCHSAHFHACKRKVERVHQVFTKRSKSELCLCPYCVEPIDNKPSPHKVVFLCGHRFHVDCVNKWFCEAPSKAGRCPICDDLPKPLQDGAKDEVNDEATNVSSNNDEAQAFILGSLHRLFPEIIPQESLKRWMSCNTEIWLSDLACPKYISTFTSMLRRSKD